MQFRPKTFWTPRYIRNRLALAIQQQRYPDGPWWPKDVITHLEDMLHGGDTCLEWGSGRSTAWLSARTKTVHSIEHNADWHARVRAQLAAQGLDADLVRLLSSEPLAQPERSPYVRVVDDFADDEIHICVVDGEHRAKCALAAVPKLASGGLLMIDDANWFLDHPSFAPHSRCGRGPASHDWREFSRMVDGWRCVWNTDGVTDTAIWIKP